MTSAFAARPPVGWGILGCGRFAQRRVLPAFAGSKITRIVAIQKRDAAQARAAADAAGVPGAYASRDELLSDKNVHAVWIAGHNAGHLGDVLACAAAGKAVLCEKPMGLNAAECRTMRDACAAKNVPLFVGHCCRYHHAVEQARALVASNALGELRALRAFFAFRCAPDVWRRDAALSGGGPLLDLGPHVADFIRHVSGREVRELVAFVDPPRDLKAGRVEDRARAILTLDGGIPAELSVSFVEPFRTGFELAGTEASLRGDYVLSAIDNPCVRLERFTGDPQPPACEKLPVAHRDLFRMQLEDVSQALLDPGHAPRCAKAGDGVKALEIIDAVYRAGETGAKTKVG